MKQLLIAIMFSSLTAHSMEAFKSTTGNNLRVLTQEAFNALDNGSIPMCIKDGGKSLEMNSAYRKILGNNRKLCSPSPANLRILKSRYNTELIVIKIAELPDQELKRLLK